MNETYEELCAEAHHLQTNFAFQATQIFVFIFSTTGIILNTYVSIAMIIGKVKFFSKLQWNVNQILVARSICL